MHVCKQLPWLQAWADQQSKAVRVVSSFAFCDDSIDAATRHFQEQLADQSLEILERVLAPVHVRALSHWILVSCEVSTRMLHVMDSLDITHEEVRS